jgi:hypothetical protein
MRLLADLTAGLFAGFGTFFCFLAAIFSGGFLYKSNRVYPAPFIATFAMFLVTLHALRGATKRVAEMIATHRNGNRPS